MHQVIDGLGYASSNSNLGYNPSNSSLVTTQATQAIAIHQATQAFVIQQARLPSLRQMFILQDSRACGLACTPNIFETKTDAHFTYVLVKDVALAPKAYAHKNS